MIRRTDFLIVSGNGRNTGKTSFICRVIKHISKQFPVTAIKVSPHFHSSENQDALFQGDQYIVWEELDLERNKDSSLMLRAGAKRVFYIEAKDEHLKKAVDILLDGNFLEGAVICESGGLRKIIEPSLFLLMNEEKRDELKIGFRQLIPMADHVISFNGEDFNLQPENIGFDGILWYSIE